MKKHSFASLAIAAAALIGVCFWAGNRPQIAVSAQRKSAVPAVSPQMPVAVTKRGEIATPLPLAEDFIEKIVDPATQDVRIPLPGGTVAEGTLTREQQGADTVEIFGKITKPFAGQFYFLRQPLPNLAGPMMGYVLFDEQDVAYRVYPAGENQTPELRKVTADQVICRSLAQVEAPDAGSFQNAPQFHPGPDTVAISPVQNGVPPLESMPGATAVVYLDFDGEYVPTSSFNSGKPITAARANLTASQIYTVWKGAVEDFTPFKINLTTIKARYDAAPITSRMHCIITPTTTAGPGTGGIAVTGTFNSNSTTKYCWVFNVSGDSVCSDTISHEVGHTLGLDHDGTFTPVSGYYPGQGTGETSWGPIMGSPYYKTLSQWSKGEYTSANNPQDDIAIISTTNNNVSFRTDAESTDFATAPYLDIATGGVVATGTGQNEGIIEGSSDVDGFRFSTLGGNVNLTVAPASTGPDVDLLAEIVRQSDGVVVASSNPPATLSAPLVLSLAAGDYLLRISTVGHGDPLTDGYTNYGCIGTYLISGTISGGVARDGFSVVENAATGNAVGSIGPRVSHGTGTVAYAISSGNTNGAFSINPANGVIRVANTAALNYEAISSGWDHPAVFEMFVAVTDSLGIATENRRVLVTVTNVNEPPVFPAITSVDLDLDLGVSPGATVATLTATDPDYLDYTSYSIISGNTGGAFTIDDYGVVKVQNMNFGAGRFDLVIQATDHLSPANTVTTPLTIYVYKTVGVPPGLGQVLTAHNAPAGATCVWSKVSGPGNIVFENANAITTAATYSAAGSYLVRVVVTSGSTSAEERIRVVAGAQAVKFNPAPINFGTVTGGSASYDTASATYTLTAASANISGTSDNFLCHGQVFSGDFDLRTRVTCTDVDATGNERAGLIVRSGTAANGVSLCAAFSYTSPDARTYRRPTVGATTSSTTVNATWPEGPRWARLQRVANTVQGYLSTNGIDWLPGGSQTMSGDVIVGLCWASGSAANSGTATFYDVTLVGADLRYNVGPVVNAGADQTNVTSPSAALTGSFTDDALPAAATVTTTWQKISGPGSITFANPAAAITSATASAPGTYQLRLITDDSEVKTYDDITVTFAPTPYFTWLQSNFGSDSGNPAIAAASADPDQDGIANLLEYACGTDPKTSNPLPITYDTTEIAGEKHLRLTAQKNPAATDVQYTIESSGDLTTPSWTAPANTVTLESNTATTITGRDDTPVSAASTRFLRLKVTQ